VNNVAKPELVPDRTISEVSDWRSSTGHIGRANSCVIHCHTWRRIEWDAVAAEHIRNRSARYSAAVDIDPAWTNEVVADPDRMVDEPDPHSAHLNSVRIVGYSSRAGMVITVVALRDRAGVLHGASAWKTRDAAWRQYMEGRND
jgi:hypothetical protein